VRFGLQTFFLAIAAVCMLSVTPNLRTAILTNDVDGVSHVTEDDGALASHLTRVVATVAILHVCTVQYYRITIIINAVSRSRRPGVILH